jgi:GTP cyclohydrolase II
LRFIRKDEAVSKNTTKFVFDQIKAHEKLRERLEKIIEQEEKRRKDDARYFNIIAQIYKEALDTEKEKKTWVLYTI